MDRDQVEIIRIIDELGEWKHADDPKRKRFIKGRECKEATAELYRYLRRFDSEIYSMLGPFNIIQSKLIPIVVSYSNDLPLMVSILKVLVRMTIPVPTISEGYLKQTGYLLDYKESMINKSFISTLIVILKEPLRRLEVLDEGKNEDYYIIELVLSLIKNLLVIADPEPQANVSIKDYRCFLHESFILILEECKFLELFLILAQNIRENKIFKSLSIYSFLLLEIFAFIFKNESPDTIWSNQPRHFINIDDISSIDNNNQNNNNIKKVEAPKEDDRLAKLLAQDAKLKAASRKKTSTSRFVGAFKKENKISSTPDALNDVTAAKIRLNALPNASLQSNAPVIGRLKASSTRRMAGPSTYKVRVILKSWAEQFLDGCYNTLMELVSEELERAESGLTSNTILATDRINYLSLTHFFTGFSLVLLQQNYGQQQQQEEGGEEEEKKKEFMNNIIGSLSSTLSLNTFNFVFSCCLMSRQTFVPFGTKNNANATDDGGLTEMSISTMKEMVAILHFMGVSGNSKMEEISMNIQSKIYYERDVFLKRVVEMIQIYHPKKYPQSVLTELTELAHTSISMVERFCQVNNSISIHSHRRAKKSSTNKGLVEDVDEEKDQDGKVMDIDKDFIDDNVETKKKKKDENINGNENVNGVDIDIEMKDQVVDDEKKETNGEKKEEKEETNGKKKAEGDQKNEKKEEGEGEEGEEDIIRMKREDDEDEYHGQSTSISFISFLSDFAKPDIVNNMCTLLGNYHYNSDKINYQLVSIFQRFRTELDLEPMFYKLSIFYCFYNLLRDPLIAMDSKAIDMVGFVKTVVNNFFKYAETNPSLLLHLCLPKTKSTSGIIMSSVIDEDMYGAGYGGGEQKKSRSDKIKQEEEYDQEEAHLGAEDDNENIVLNERRPPKSKNNASDSEGEENNFSDEEQIRHFKSLQESVDTATVTRRVKNLLKLPDDSGKAFLKWIEQELYDAIKIRGEQLKLDRFSPFVLKHLSLTAKFPSILINRNVVDLLLTSFKFRGSATTKAINRTFSIPENRLFSPSYLSFLVKLINDTKSDQKKATKKKQVSKDEEEEEEELEIIENELEKEKVIEKELEKDEEDEEETELEEEEELEIIYNAKKDDSDFDLSDGESTNNQKANVSDQEDEEKPTTSLPTTTTGKKLRKANKIISQQEEEEDVDDGFGDISIEETIAVEKMEEEEDDDDDEIIETSQKKQPSKIIQEQESDISESEQVSTSEPIIKMDLEKKEKEIIEEETTTPSKKITPKKTTPKKSTPTKATTPPPTKKNLSKVTQVEKTVSDGESDDDDDEEKPTTNVNKNNKKSLLTKRKILPEQKDNKSNIKKQKGKEGAQKVVEKESSEESSSSGSEAIKKKQPTPTKKPSKVVSSDDSSSSSSSSEDEKTKPKKTILTLKKPYTSPKKAAPSPKKIVSSDDSSSDSSDSEQEKKKKKKPAVNGKSKPSKSSDSTSSSEEEEQPTKPFKKSTTATTKKAKAKVVSSDDSSSSSEEEEVKKKKKKVIPLKKPSKIVSSDDSSSESEAEQPKRVQVKIPLKKNNKKAPIKKPVKKVVSSDSSSSSSDEEEIRKKKKNIAPQKKKYTVADDSSSSSSEEEVKKKRKVVVPKKNVPTKKKNKKVVSSDDSSSSSSDSSSD
ncbi:timeless family protein [Cavenderia fasciculata]|uniref:Timeless family protein n=1 Tax=Cavenderia fasciculata TaxID=261658 RepID=F4PIF7_CACFS|nr:timeless family protein [Cavenderia fasciculata]EGG25386.1 timeless family protein [Cavenderia fasciculata]|eukprot:XP_004363237.1 timeless family protein [Cavenderia fasciculata]